MGTKLRKFALAFGMCFAACGGKTGDEAPPAPGSGIDAAKRVNDLSEAERAKLCDFAAQKLGGYGTRRECGNNFYIPAPKNKTSCIASSRKPCNATVGDVEACSSQTSCDNPFPGACAPIATCAFVTN